MFKSKLHQIAVTEANLFYEGSITIDEDLLEMAELLPYEKVQIVNINNGERFETYTIPGPRGSRICCLNGPAARKVQVQDRVIVISYAEMSPEEARKHKPKVVILNKHNEPIEVMNYSVYATEIIPD
jgi:aspartate 1-decarboxylase